MSDSSGWEGDDVIRISRQETLSSHAEDLLKRQKSLRGESGITRTPGGKWYYQNWFVFMVAGASAALLAWAILEPHFNDTQYLQGPIDDLNMSDSLSTGPIQVGAEYVELRIPALGWIKIRDTKVWLLEETKEIHHDGRKAPIDRDRLAMGQEVGVYTEYLPIGPEESALAHFLVSSPSPQSPERASLTLSQQLARTAAAGLLMFALVAGLIGLAIGASDGVICRLPRRALLAGGVGLAVGFIGGFISNIIANIVYAPLNRLAMEEMGPTIGSFSTFGFIIQLVGRGLAWALAGTAAGLGQGIVLRSKRLLLYGFLGGIVGGLLGGLLFDPIDLLLLGPEKPSAHWSRLIGFTVIGGSVGAMIGIVELMARDAWLRMTAGPLAGKEFLIFKDVMKVGSSPRSDIYLFKDSEVAEQHANLRMSGDECEIEAIREDRPVQINNRPVRRSRLRHGDVIAIGRTSFVFQKRGK